MMINLYCCFHAACARVCFDRLRCVRNRVLLLTRSHLHAVLELETSGSRGRRCHRRGCCGRGDYVGLPVSSGGGGRGEDRVVPSQGTSSRSPSGLEDHRRRVADSDTGGSSLPLIRVGARSVVREVHSRVHEERTLHLNRYTHAVLEDNKYW